MRHFATQDDIGNAFRVVHAMKSIGVTPDRETYRYLMFSCCKYADVELGLYAMENMLYDNRPDFRSFKRLFDTCASGVDLRLWVAYDVMRWFYPLEGFTSAALRTTAYITEMMKTLGMRQSSRAGRGFITLPNPRGDPPDPFVALFEDYDPNYPEEEEHAQAMENAFAIEAGKEPPLKARLRLIPEEFEDKNNMAKIVARNRKRQLSGDDEVALALLDEGSSSLALLEKSGWSQEVLLQIISEERKVEMDHLLKLEAGLRQKAEFDARPPISLWKAIGRLINTKKD